MDNRTKDIDKAEPKIPRGPPQFWTILNTDAYDPPTWKNTSVGDDRYDLLVKHV